MNAIVERKPKSAYDQLRRRHKRFVDAYVVGGTGSDAVVAMGYKGKWAKQLAYEFLKNPRVQEAIDEQTRIHCESQGARHGEIIRELLAIARADPRKLVKDGRRLELHELDDDTAHALAGVEIEEVSTNGRIGTRYKYKFWDKNKAIDKLGLYRGLWQPGTTNVNVDARSVTVNSNSPQGAAALQGAVRLLEQVRRIGIGEAATVSDSDGSVLPAAVRDESLGRGSPVDVRADPGSRGES